MPTALGPARVVALAISIVAVLAAAAPASANHVQCGDTITQDTTLDSDLLCAADGLTIDGDQVTLDLAGHSITGSGTGIGIAPVGGLVVEVRGGTVRGFGAALFSDGPRSLIVREMLIERNGAGVRCNYSDECRVLDSSFFFNGATAINAYSPDNGGIAEIRGNVVRHNMNGISITDYTATVTDNRVERNSGFGVELDYGAQGGVSSNVVSHNGGDGVLITFNSDVTLTSNRIQANGGDGVEAEGAGGFTTGADLIGNRISGNAGDGVRFGFEVVGVIDSNRTDRNGDDGIDVDAADPLNFNEVVVRANRAFFNADLGIEAVSATTDGGGNRAKHNGNPAQCVGVRCK
jgi:parallel beta-helix repeat protein